MKVIVDDVVVKEINSFYSAAMSRHITLSEETVMAKKKRLIDALGSLSDYHALQGVLEARNSNNPILRPTGRSVGRNARRKTACQRHATIHQVVNSCVFSTRHR